MCHKQWKCFFVEYGLYSRNDRCFAIQAGIVKDLIHNPTYHIGVGFMFGKNAFAFGLCWGKNHSEDKANG